MRTCCSFRGPRNSDPVGLVDAPVSGSTHPAEEDQLTILASGPESARPAVAPIFAALAETMHLCRAMGLDQQHFVALLDGGPLGSAYALQKLDEMQRHEYPAGFPVRLALKDLELVREVEQSSPATMPLLDVVVDRFRSASEDLADQDLAAIYELDRRSES